MKKEDKAPVYERLSLCIAVVLGLAAIAVGGYLAYRTTDPHWMNRAGATIVAVQVLVIIVEFRRRDRLQTLFYRKLLTTISHLKENDDTEESRDLKALRFLEGEIKKAEGHVLLVVVVLAMVGELLHGFGDMLMKVLIH